MFLPNVAEMAFCVVCLILSQGLLAPIEFFDFLKAAVYLYLEIKAVQILKMDNRRGGDFIV